MLSETRKTAGRRSDWESACAERVLLSCGARNHLPSVMEAGCRVKLSAVANGPVITQLYIRCAAFTQRQQNKAGKNPKIETPN